MQNSARLRERTVWQALDRLNADSPRKGSGKGGEGSGMARFYAFIFMLVGWFSVIGHYVAKSDFHSLAGTIDYFSYFTMLSNTLVAATFTAAALFAETRAGRFLLSPPVALATAVYISITGLVFYFLLSGLYDLHGWEARYDHLLHYVMPPAYVLFWLLYMPKGALHLQNVPWIMVPPLVYGGWSLLHGAISGFYPYPFLNVTKLGYANVFAHIVEFVFVFAFVAVAFVFLDRLIHHYDLQSAPAPDRQS